MMQRKIGRDTLLCALVFERSSPFYDELSSLQLASAWLTLTIRERNRHL